MSRLVLPAVLCAALALPATAAANTIAVNSPDDNQGTAGCSLREAIELFDGTPITDHQCVEVAATGTDTVTFAPEMSQPGTEITLIPDPGSPSQPRPLDIGSSINIAGPGANLLAVSGNDFSRVLQVGPGLTVEISGMTFKKGLAPELGGSSFGGCVFNGNTAQLVLQSMRVTDCHARAEGSSDLLVLGGGIYAEGDVTIDDSILDGNSVTATNDGNTATSAYARGGALFTNSGGEALIRRSTISGNQATADDNGTGETQAASALFFVDASEVERSTVSGNTSSSDQTGGGPTYSATIHQVEGNGVIGASTVAENFTNLSGSAQTFPSAVLMQSTGNTMRIRNSTIASNGPTSLTDIDGVNLFVWTGEANVADTIIANPTGGGENCVALGAIESDGYNIDYSPAGESCFLTPPVPDTDLETDPLLATAGLAQNGGPTQTIALQPASPAIDAGFSDGSDSDQRDLLRPVDFPGLANATGGDGSDIGAFEVQQGCAGQATPSTTCANPNPPANPPAKTGKRAKALKKCKKISKKKKKKRKKCIRRAKKQPV